MSKYLLFLAVLLIGHSSCQKEIYDQMEANIVGTWEFTNARQRTHDAFAGFYSIFSYYENDFITFNADKTAFYQEANGDELTGIWDVRLVETTDSDGNSSSQYVISIVLTSPTGELVQYVWETDRYINNYLKVDENTSDYVYCFELRR